MKPKLRVEIHDLKTNRMGRVPIDDHVVMMRMFLIMSMIMEIVRGVPPPSVHEVVDLMVELVGDEEELQPLIHKLKEMMLMLMWFRTTSITIDDKIRFHFAKRDFVKLHTELQKMVLGQPHYLSGLFNKHCMVIAGLTTRVGTPEFHVAVTPKFMEWSKLIGQMIEELKKLKKLKKL